MRPVLRGFRCKYCLKFCTDRLHIINLHQTTECLKRPLFLCHICSHVANLASDLGQHLVDCHLSKCDKCTTHSIDLLTHSCSHENAVSSENEPNIQDTSKSAPENRRECEKDASTEASIFPESTEKFEDLSAFQRSEPNIQDTAELASEILLECEKDASTKTAFSPELTQKEKVEDSHPEEDETESDTANINVSKRRKNASPIKRKEYKQPTEAMLEEQKKYLPKSIQDYLDVKNCLICDVEFLTRYDAIRHIKNNHLSLKKFKCDFCDFSDAKLRKLRNHFFDCHEGQQMDQVPKGRGRPRKKSISQMNAKEILVRETKIVQITRKSIRARKIPKNDDFIQLSTKSRAKKKPEEIPKGGNSTDREKRKEFPDESHELEGPKRKKIRKSLAVTLDENLNNSLKMLIESNAIEEIIPQAEEKMPKKDSLKSKQIQNNSISQGKEENVEENLPKKDTLKSKQIQNNSISQENKTSIAEENKKAEEITSQIEMPEKVSAKTVQEPNTPITQKSVASKNDATGISEMKGNAPEKDSFDTKNDQIIAFDNLLSDQATSDKIEIGLVKFHWEPENFDKLGLDESQLVPNEIGLTSAKIIKDYSQECGKLIDGQINFLVPVIHNFHQCKPCSYKFEQRKAYLDHMKTVHKDMKAR